jgi:hypothetical protein
MQTYLTTEPPDPRHDDRSLYSLVQAGKLAVHYLGPSRGLVRFTEEDLDRYVRSCRTFGSRAPSPPAALRRRAPRSASAKSSHPDAREVETPAPNPPRSAVPPLRTTRGKFGA